MRLHSRTGATAIDAPEGHFDAGEDGAFDLPEDVGQRLHGFHAGGKPSWETDIERQHRLVAEELERRKDPATLLDAVQQIVQAAQAMGQANAGSPGDSESRPAARRGGKTAGRGGGS